MIDYESIGSRIKYYRVTRGISQEELAEKTELSRVHISCIERGERIPSLAAIINIANALNVTVDELVSENLFFSDVSHESGEFDILYDCTQEESSIITKCMMVLKEILRSYKITK